MSTITREFTKEQLIARINQVTAINKYRISRDPDADGLAMDNELLAIALASLEAEGKLSNFVASQESLGGDFEKVLAENIEELYVPSKSAAPAPVSVPDELTREEYKRRFMEEDNFDDTFRGGWNSCRAAMLQGAEHVTTAYKLPELRYLDTVKFNADCALQDPESIYAQEFFMSLDEVFGERGNYTEPVQAKAVSILIAEIFRLRGYPAAPQQEVK